MAAVSKLIFIGAERSGKTSVVRRFNAEMFHEDYIPTIGVDFLNYRHNGLTLQMWETAGQERFRAITVNYYRGMHTCAVVCDLSDEQGLANAEREAQGFRQVNQTAKMLLIGNKADLQRQVSLNQVYNFCNRFRAEYFQCSAKEGFDIGQLACALMPGPEHLPPDVPRPAVVVPLTQAQMLNAFMRELGEAVVRVLQ